MSDISRRKFLGAVAATPLAAAFVGAAAEKQSATPRFAPVTQQYARKRLQEQHLPNLPLTNQDGKQVHFYDDLVKGKVVTLNFFYAQCDEVCPMVSANLARVQKMLGAQVGRDIHMYSFTLKPEEDTVEVIRKYREKYHAGPGWDFFTAKPHDMEKLRKAIGFTYPDPKIDADKTQHIGNIRYGNEPLMYWSACPGMAHADFIVESLEWVIHPDMIRIQPS